MASGIPRPPSPALKNSKALQQPRTSKGNKFPKSKSNKRRGRMGFHSPPPPSSYWNSNFRNFRNLRNLRMARSPLLLYVPTCTSTSTRLNASSSSSSSSGSDKEPEWQGLTRSAAYSLLKQRLAAAAKFEDYKEAARLRDSLRTFEEEEPVLQLRNLLKKAVEEERFQEAAKYRDQLKELAPHAFLKCSSDATTLVRSVYVESRSQPMEGQFFYAYRIRISNNSGQPVQLLRRHWIVTDERGRAEHVWGTGVVGQQPVIPPGAAFEYSSACPLGTPSGRMEGDFEMKLLLLPDSGHFFTTAEENKKKNNNSSTSTSTFNVAIAPFSLSIFDDDCSSSSAFLY